MEEIWRGGSSKAALWLQLQSVALNPVLRRPRRSSNVGSPLRTNTARPGMLKAALIELADGGGFEPPVPFSTHALQACTINHSVTHPV
jgi:hypothetical protein